MEPELYKTYLDNYVLKHTAILDRLSTLRECNFGKIYFNSRDIDLKFFEERVEYFKKVGLTNKHQVLYYFQLITPLKGPSIQDKINQMKNLPGKRMKSLPKVNLQECPLQNNVLYVGKKEGNFYGRFKQHLGLSGEGTYSLHFSDWAKEMNLDLCLYFMPFSFDADNIYLLEHLENVLHFGMKPLLGRSGH